MKQSECRSLHILTVLRDVPLGLLLEIIPLFFHSSKVCDPELPAFTTRFTFCFYTCFELLLKPEPKPPNNVHFCLTDWLITLPVLQLLHGFWQFSSKKIHSFHSRQVIGGMFRAIYSQLLGWSDCSCTWVKFQDDWGVWGKGTWEQKYVAFHKSDERTVDAFFLLCVYTDFCMWIFTELYELGPWSYQDR